MKEPSLPVDGPLGITSDSLESFCQGGVADGSPEKFTILDTTMLVLIE